MYTKFTDTHLRMVAEVYQESIEAGYPPTTAVSETWGISHSTATKWVARVRRAGLLPKTSPGANTGLMRVGGRGGACPTCGAIPSRQGAAR